MEQLESITLKIGGMTCINCQHTIEDALISTDGVVSANVSYGSGTAEITFDAQKVTESRLHKIIEEHDYKVITDENTDPRKLLYPFIIFAIIVAVYVPLQVFGLLNYLAPSDLADSSMGYGMLFVIGLITSVHCIAMCGGINLSQCIPKSSDSVQKGLKTFIPAVAYNVGRVLSYTVIGFILGLVGWIIGGGGSFGISNIIQGIFKLIAGLLMIIMGINMLGIIPALRKLNPTMPKFLAKKIGKKKSTATSPFIVGVLNGIMPCGPLQSMWLVALATGNPFSGALSMLLFALGTVPLMLGLGSIVSKLGQKFTKAVMTVGSILVAVLGLAMLSQGGSLTGAAFLSPGILAPIILALILAGVICSIPLDFARISSKTLKITTRVVAACLVVVVGLFAVMMSGSKVDGSFDVSALEGDIQIVRSELGSGTYPKIAVKKDIPVRWIIYVDDDSLNGCNEEVLIPEYDIDFMFDYGENIIEFTPTKAGTFRYSCWMGMIYGTIVVE